MKKIMIALTLALATSTVALAQDSTLSQKTTTNPAPVKTRLNGSIAFNGIFTRQWTENVPGVDTRDLAGWGVMPDIHLWKPFDFQADFQSSYTTDVYPSINKFSIMAGPRLNLNPYWHHLPHFQHGRTYLFGEAGETRTTYGRYWGEPNPYPTRADWNPTASAGIGFEANITPRFGLQFIPGEWTGERFDWNEKWQNNYQARFGFVFNLR